MSFIISLTALENDEVEITTDANEDFRIRNKGTGDNFTLGGVTFWVSDAEPADAAPDDVWIETGWHE